MSLFCVALKSTLEFTSLRTMVNINNIASRLMIAFYITIVFHVFFVTIIFVSELESQFNHRKVTFKRNKDVRTGFDMLCEIGR